MARAKLYASAAERQAAYRARVGAKTVSVSLPAGVAAAFDGYCERQMADGAGLTRSQVVERLIRATIMRRR